MSTKSLPDAQADAARAFLRRIVAEDFAGNQSKAAVGLKVSQSQISDAMSGRRGFGVLLLQRIADYSRVTIEQVTGSAPRMVLDYRYDSLRKVVEAPENRSRWSRGAIEEAKTIEHDADSDPGEGFWMEALDQLQTGIKLARSGLPKLPQREAAATELEPSSRFRR